MGLFSSSKKHDPEFYTKTGDVGLLLSAMLRVKPSPDGDKLVGRAFQDAYEKWWDTEYGLMRILARSLGKTLPGSVPALIQALQDKRWGVWKRGATIYCPRSEVLRVLGKSGDESAFEFLCAELADEDSPCGEAAASTLGDMGDPRALEPLIAAMNGPSAEVRGEAIAALGRLRDPKAVEPLLALISPHGTGWLREKIIIALGDIGDRRAVQPLLQAYEKADIVDKGRIVEALGKIGDPAAGDFLLTEADKDLHRMGGRPDAVLALAGLNHPQAADFIEAYLKKGAFMLFHIYHLELLKALYALRNKSIPVAFFVPYLDKLHNQLERLTLPNLFHKKGPLFSPERAKLVAAAAGNFQANLKNAAAALPGLINTGDTQGLAELKEGLARMCRDFSDETMVNRIEDVCGPLFKSQFSQIVDGAAAAAGML